MTPTALDVANRLFQTMNEIVPQELYPPSVKPIPNRRIAGAAFFPGGSGLYLEDRVPATVDFPVGGVMILGHNFDSETGFSDSEERGREKLTTGAWGRLIQMLNEAAIPIDRCFFTNAFMGLCEGSDNEKYAGRKDQGFRRACRGFLSHQIHTQRPRLIVTLGVFVPPLLACASPGLKAWSDRCSGSDPKLVLKHMDENPIFKSVEFGFSDVSHFAVVTAIAHPSDKRNGRRRHPNGFPSGDRGGEVELIREGWRESRRYAP
jgi:hypothetical protein